MQRLPAHFTDEEAEAVCVEEVEGRAKSRCQCCSSRLRRLPPTLSFVVLRGTKKPQLFSDQNVFHNTPSGAFPLGTGRSLGAPRAVSLPTAALGGLLLQRAGQNRPPEAPGCALSQRRGRGTPPPGLPSDRSRACGASQRPGWWEQVPAAPGKHCVYLEAVNQKDRKSVV